MIARILQHVGGAGNVAQAGNCLTRLRLTLRDVPGSANVLQDPRYLVFIYFCHCRLPVSQRSGVAQRLADIAIIFCQQRLGIRGA